MKKYFCLLILFFLFFFQSIFAQSKYEFRAVWVTTVNNSDFPSTKSLSTEAQKAEFINLLEMHKRNGMNALVVQIRPSADAFYPSPYEPWSEYLMGTQGKPPIPYYDPLEFMITETHNHGMEFHAWMNPYRAVNNIEKSSISPTHITNLHPEWFINYGSKKYFDPGNKQVQKFVVNVVKDVVSRYKIDAIHFDDYFYPYRNDTISFDDYFYPGIRISGINDYDDSKSFSKYGNGMDIQSWRRNNVDSIISMISRVIKQENKFCKFGISPFAVWRNKDKDPDGSDTHAGHTNYDDLYADVLLWLKMGWIDYVVPQLYWETGNKVVDYEILVDWWAKHAYGKQLYIGQGMYRAVKARSEAWKNKNELPNQIKKLREYPQIQGSIYFTSKTFKSNPNGWTDSLRSNYYKYPAIPPPMKWIDSSKPQPPLLLLYDNSAIHSYKGSINLYFKQDVLNNMIKQYVIYEFKDTKNIDTNDPKNIKEIIMAGNNFYSFDLGEVNINQNKIVIAASCLSTTNNESNLSQYILMERQGNGWRVVPQSNGE